MDACNHPTFSVKREPDFSPGLGFNSQTPAYDMDFTSFLGEPGGLSE